MTMTLAISPQRPGVHVTFYSYKGGVGRSMALANIGALLARRGLRVLLVDWDLEAPGLERYFTQEQNCAITGPEDPGGVLSLLERPEEGGPDEGRVIDYRQFLQEVRLPESSEFSKDTPTLDLLPSGSATSNYAQRIADFDWPHFIDERRGAEWLELLRSQWRRDYDFVLIDSRTGYTDSGGVCTVFFPDVLVLVFAANEQNLEGSRRVAEHALAARNSLPFDRAPLTVFPLLARFDSQEEFHEANKWLNRVTEEFKPYFRPWLPRSLEPRRVFERTKVPYTPIFSFGERLAVLEQGLSAHATCNLDRNAIGVEEHLRGDVAQVLRLQACSPGTPVMVDCGHRDMVYQWSGLSGRSQCSEQSDGDVRIIDEQEISGGGRLAIGHGHHLATDLVAAKKLAVEQRGCGDVGYGDARMVDQRRESQWQVQRRSHVFRSGRRLLCWGHGRRAEGQDAEHQGCGRSCERIHRHHARLLQSVSGQIRMAPRALVQRGAQHQPRNPEHAALPRA